MAKFTMYKNSKLASVCSFIGYMLIIAGVYFAFNDYVGPGIIMLVIAIGFKVLASFISRMKAAKEAKKNAVQ